MVSRESKVNFNRQSSVDGEPDYEVVYRPYDATVDAYVLTEIGKPRDKTVTLETTDHAPGIHEVFIEENDANPLQLALLGNAAFQKVAIENRAIIDKTNVFALVDIRHGDLEEELARKILYERAFGMEAVNVTRKGELIMLGGTEQEVSGSSTWVMRGNGVYRPQNQSDL